MCGPYFFTHIVISAAHTFFLQEYISFFFKLSLPQYWKSVFSNTWCLKHILNIIFFALWVESESVVWNYWSKRTYSPLLRVWFILVTRYGSYEDYEEGTGDYYDSTEGYPGKLWSKFLLHGMTLCLQKYCNDYNNITLLFYGVLVK